MNYSFDISYWQTLVFLRAFVYIFSKELLSNVCLQWG